MPKLIGDSWAWWRTYLSANGPTKQIRQTLDGYMRCMNRNGRGCWPSVRHVAELTKLNKTTVSKYRRQALAQGWLVKAPRAEARHRGELWASVPDNVPIDVRFVSGLVLPDGTRCPTAWDISPNTSFLRTLKTRGLSKGNREKADDASERVTSLQAQLKFWLASDATAKHYRGDRDSLERLTPEFLRFDGYRNVIDEVEETLRQNPSADETEQRG
jgi:DNA-binding transcriptional MocR family regulator